MSDQVDIVDRFRINWTSLTDKQNAERNEAADEIERLREQLRLANIDCFNMTVERDQARLSLCLLMEAYTGGDGKVTANKLGWGYLCAEEK